MSTVEGVEAYIAETIHPMLRHLTRAFVLVGEYNDQGRNRTITVVSRPSMLGPVRPSALVRNFGEHLLENGVMRTCYTCFNGTDGNDDVSILTKMHPILQETLDRYALMAVDHDTNALVSKYAINGFYAMALLVAGHKNRKQYAL